MSVSLSRIKSFATRALARRPSDWDTPPNSYGRGQNPWLDLYPETKVVEIAKILGRLKPEDIHDLRLLLASAADDVAKTFRLIGDPASGAKKRNWVDRAIKDAKRLNHTLRSGGGHFVTHAEFLNLGQKEVVRIVPSSVFASATEKLVASIDEFIKLIESTARHLAVADEAPSGESKSTTHSLYLQYAVDRMTEIFVFLRGRDAVKRISEGKEIRGEYPEFIRAATIPMLIAYYNGFDDPDFKLNAQIQDAALRYGKRAC